MPTARAEPDVQQLIDAYQTLDVELNASSSAIRLRYRELALLHHPDKQPHGSAEQATAASRMSAINAAYARIQDAPLRGYRPPGGVPDDPPTRSNPEVWFERPVSVATDTFIRLGLGAASGFWLAFVLERRGVPGFWFYVWLLPFLTAFAFTSTLTSGLLRVLVRWI